MTARPLSYTNRKNAAYYVHAGKTKTGKPRYFVAKTEGEGVLSELPEERRDPRNSSS